MAKASGTDLAGFDGQLKTTQDVLQARRSGRLHQGRQAGARPCNSSPNSCSTTAFSARARPSADFVGVEFPGGKIDRRQVQGQSALRYDLYGYGRERGNSDRSLPAPPLPASRHQSSSREGEGGLCARSSRVLASASPLTRESPSAASHRVSREARHSHRPIAPQPARTETALAPDQSAAQPWRKDRPRRCCRSPC